VSWRIDVTWLRRSFTNSTQASGRMRKKSRRWPGCERRSTSPESTSRRVAVLIEPLLVCRTSTSWALGCSGGSQISSQPISRPGHPPEPALLERDGQVLHEGQVRGGSVIRVAHGGQYART